MSATAATLMTKSLMLTLFSGSSSFNCLRISAVLSISTSVVRKMCGMGPSEVTSRRAMVARIVSVSVCWSTCGSVRFHTALREANEEIGLAGELRRLGDAHAT